MTVRGRTVFLRTLNPPWKAVVLPRSRTPLRTITVSQHTEPGTLRAVVGVDFTGTPALPSHCWPYLPPAMTVRVIPR
jgi:hypothetical protein